MLYLTLLASAHFGSMTFEANRGQTDPRALFLARTPAAGAVFVTAREIVLHRDKRKPARISFAGSNPRSAWRGVAPTGHETDYFIGRDPGKWIRALQSFERLERRDLYPGIDLVLYGNEKNQLEYDLIVAPGADPGRIRIHTGAAAAAIDPLTGDLVLDGIRQHKPVILQNQVKIAGSFKRLSPREFGFAIAPYDRGRPLTIDPVIESREYLGGLGDDSVSGVSGQGFVSGTTASIDFPDAPLGLRRGTDVFLRGFGRTYIMGGSGDETAAAVNFGLDNFATRVFLAGTTTSRDLPAANRIAGLPAQFTEYQGGASDGFIWAFDLSFTTGFLPFAVYFGTAGDDRINAVSVSSEGFAIVGSTNGNNLPAGSAGPRPQAARAGNLDAFLATGRMRFPPDFQILNSTYLGGFADDRAFAVAAVSNGGDLYVGGETASAEFPVPGGAAVQRERKGSTDAFLLRFANPFGEAFALLGGTLLGGGGADRIHSLAWSPATRTILAAGTTTSLDFPLAQPLQSAHAGGASDAFLASFGASLAQLARSTYFGGSGADEGLAVEVDSQGHHFLAGRTASRDLLTRNPIQPGYGGGASDGFLVHFDPLGGLDYATYYGGLGEDEILALGGANGPTVYAGGATNSTDLPGPAGRSGSVPVSIREGFVVRISNAAITMPALTLVGKGTRAAVPVTFGDGARILAAGRATVESAVPSRVLVSFAGLAGPLDTAIWNAAGAWPGNINVECLADSGDTDVTVRVPGYADQVARVRCVPGQLAIAPQNAVPLLTGETLEVTVVYGINDPERLQFRQLEPRFAPDAQPVATVASGNAQVVLAQPPTAGRSVTTLRAISPGDTVVTASAPGFASASLPVTVTAAPRRIDAAVGFDTSQYAPCLQPCRVRSLDPDRVLLLTTYLGFGSAEVAIGDGDLRIRVLNGAAVGAEARLEISQASGPFTPFRIVRVVEPVIRPTNAFSDPISILRGQPAYIDLTYEIGNPSISDPISRLTVASSNPAVFTVTRSAQQIRLVAIGDGMATLTLRASAGLRLSPELDRAIPVRVISNALSLQDFDLGEDLTATQPISLPSVPVNVAINATISTSTPALLQLVTPTGGLSSSVSLPVDGYNATAYFKVTGLADQGEGRVTVSLPGFAPVTAAVRLRPSGFIWLAAGLDLQAGASASLLAVPAALDPASRIPLLTQDYRLAQQYPATFAIESSNPGAARIGFNEASQRTVTGVAAGEADLILRQPDGFTIPATRQRLRAVVTAAPAAAPKVSVRVGFTGRGAISGSIACAASPCIQLVTPYSPVRLVATPAPGYRFIKWTLDSCPGLACSFNPSGNSDLTAVFIPDIAPASAALQFVSVAPCRLVDTRNPNGPLGGPALAARGTRNFPLRQACALPADARAYSLNITVAPRGGLGFLSVWPGGQPQPIVSTLNSVDGRIKANAAIVPAGDDGSINLYATDLTDVIVDVNGAFIPQGGNAFYPMAPCRVLDTRTSPASTLTPLNAQSYISIRSQLCPGWSGRPPANLASLAAFALNVTAVPKTTLGYLTLWPAGAANRPVVSTLNAPTGTIVANMAIVPSGGSSGDISAFASDSTDLILDLVGYFAPPDAALGGLNFYPLAPCRAVDTRGAESSLGGPILEANAARQFPLLDGPCGLPSAARAYSVSATAVPSALPLGYLTLSESGLSRPLTSTLNAVDGGITSNAAIVNAGALGQIWAYASGRTHLILDINGYFAP